MTYKPSILRNDQIKQAMWPAIIGAGIAALLIKAFSDANDEKQDDERPKRVFISFAMEDVVYRDHLVKQAKKKNSPFGFTDMSVKKPWNEAEWQEKCRSRIKSCDGMIVLLTKNTRKGKGARWEIRTAKEERVPVVAMHVKKNDKAAKLPELGNSKVIDWTWDNLADQISRF